MAAFGFEDGGGANRLCRELDQASDKTWERG
jgi:hypothetical protein